MSQLHLERCLGRLLTDPGFRVDFFSRPESTLAREGLEVSDHEQRALERLPVTKLLELASMLDRGVQRPNLMRNHVAGLERLRGG